MVLKVSTTEEREPIRYSGELTGPECKLLSITEYMLTGEDQL